jgi:hypothetical protein
MRYVTIPGAIVLKHPLSGEAAIGPDARPVPPQTFARWLFDVVLNDPRMGSTPAELVRVGKLVDAFAKVKPADVVGVEDSDFEKVRAIANAPTTGFPPLYAMQLAPFSRAVLDAPEEDPRALIAAAVNGAAS